MSSSDLNLMFPDDFRRHSGSVDLPDGKYKGVIKSIKNKIQISSGRKVIEFLVEVKNKDGSKTIVKLSPDNDIKSPWLQNTLINLGHKLGGGKQINLNKDVGAKVEVEISNVNKGDKTYCNINKMVKIAYGTEVVDNKSSDKSSAKAKSQSKPSSKSWNDEWADDTEDDDAEDTDLDDEEADDDDVDDE